MARNSQVKVAEETVILLKDLLTDWEPTAEFMAELPFQVPDDLSHLSRGQAAVLVSRLIKKIKAAKAQEREQYVSPLILEMTRLWDNLRRKLRDSR